MEAARFLRNIVQRRQNAAAWARLSVISQHFDSEGSSKFRGDTIAGSLAAAAGLTAVAAAAYEISRKTPAQAEAETVALNPKEFVKFKLKETQKLNHNTSIFRFELDPQTSLGLHVASCIMTRAPDGEGEEGKPKFVIRPYTPISFPDQKGHFDLLIKVYPNGKMSNHIHSLKPGDELEVKGPIPKLPYKPNMKHHIGMIAGGTGLTPMLQVIDAILRNPEDNTQLTLMFFNNTREDILLKDYLDQLQARHPNFKVHHVVSFPDKDWVGGTGHINLDVARKGLPPPSEDSLILVCGPPGMMNAVSGDKAPDRSQGELTGLLKELGYTKEQVYKF